MNILFFGSTSDSVIVLNALVKNEQKIAAVITQPSKPVGRKKIVTPTPVAEFAQENGFPVFWFDQNPEKPWLFADENEVVSKLESLRYDLVVSASFGQKIPDKVIQKAHHDGINIHPSLLPRFRGADPVPWSILAGDRKTGVSLITISPKFDKGKILAQKTRALAHTALPDPVRTELFQTGTQMLVKLLKDPDNLPEIPVSRLKSEPYAYRFSRDDGYIPWEIMIKSLDQRTKTEDKGLKTEDLSKFLKLPIPSKLTEINTINLSDIPLIIERMVRALSPWPGVWCVVKEKRVKILEAHLGNEKLELDLVQLEGKKPVLFREFQKAYL